MMKLTAKLPMGLVLALLIIPILLFPGCGDNKTVPDKSTITITPSSRSLTGIPGDTILNYTVTVRYSDGFPMPNAIIHITGAFAEPTTAAAYQFYWYPDGTNRSGGNSAVNSGFDAMTNDSGVYEFSVVVYGPGSSFDDTIYVTSGTASGSATLSLSST